MCLLGANRCLGAGCHNVVLEVSDRFRVALPGGLHKPAAFGGFPVALGGFPVAPGGFLVAPGGFLVALGGFQNKVLPSV